MKYFVYLWNWIVRNKLPDERGTERLFQFHSRIIKCDMRDELLRVFASQFTLPGKEKIVEILKKRVQNLIVSDLISPLYWDDFADELLAFLPVEEKKDDDEPPKYPTSYRDFTMTDKEPAERVKLSDLPTDMEINKWATSYAKRSAGNKIDCMVGAMWMRDRLKNKNK